MTGLARKQTPVAAQTCCLLTRGEPAESPRLDHPAIACRPCARTSRSSVDSRRYGLLRAVRRDNNLGRAQASNHPDWCGVLCNVWRGDCSESTTLFTRFAVMLSRPMIANRCMRRRMRGTLLASGTTKLIGGPEKSCDVDHNCPNSRLQFFWEAPVLKTEPRS